MGIFSTLRAGWHYSVAEREDARSGRVNGASLAGKFIDGRELRKHLTNW
jgi:hypothetical protein